MTYIEYKDYCKENGLTMHPADLYPSKNDFKSNKDGFRGGFTQMSKYYEITQLPTENLNVIVTSGKVTFFHKKPSQKRFTCTMSNAPFAMAVHDVQRFISPTYTRFPIGTIFQIRAANRRTVIKEYTKHG